MKVIGIGDLQMMDGAKFPGIVVQATREELQAAAGNVLYKDVEVVPVADKPKGGNYWGDVLEGFVKRLLAVDERVRSDRATRKYSRAEVLAMLDEIDPDGETKGGAV